MKDMNFSQARAYLKNMPVSISRFQIISHLRSAADMQGTESFQRKAAEELLEETRPENAVPEVYREYRPIVRDGIRFLFSRLSPERLFAIIANQLLMKTGSSAQERLITLAKEIPSLHKLGQIIARNRNTEPQCRKWLIQLENGLYGTDAAVLRKEIRKEMDNYLHPYKIRADAEILSEASVGSVMGFAWTAPHTGTTSRGVFKIIRPGVREHLTEEFRILDDLARFFHRNREKYSLKNFKFIETFADIRDALQEEINLRGEQEHLREAADFYKKNKNVRIPRLLPFSTENITVMEFMEGEKITDIPMPPPVRRQCARILFETLIWQPLFSPEENPLFHGDPHAGNIYGCRDAKGNPSVVLLDWSLCGRLSKSRRMKMVRLIIGILMENEDTISHALIQLSREAGEFRQEGRVKGIVRDILRSREYADCRFMEKAFYFIDRTAIQGIRFPKDLLLFRKSFFTIDGVLRSIDPDFSMDACVFRLMENMMLEELPGRWMGIMMPRVDHAENYRSLLSNKDLQLFAFQFLMEYMRRGMGSFSGLTEAYFFPAVTGILPGNINTVSLGNSAK